ncbi:MAG: hypothetical protein R3F05_00330 [Planctomycetota bacterium]
MHDLRAQRGHIAYPLEIAGGRVRWFTTFVAPGRYDIVGTDRSGREHVVARDVEAGQRGVELELPR